MTRPLYLRSTLLLASFMAVAGCANDDSGDSGNDSVDDGTTSAPTTGGETQTNGSDPSTGTEETSAGAAQGDIEVTVIYEGQLTGTLKVAAIAYPPSAPPQDVLEDAQPAFPWTGTLEGVEAGEYLVFASIDVGNDSPMLPGAEDPQAAIVDPIVVEADGSTSVEITLTDP
ncbi:MAG: hypothetical protein KDK70_26100 [Myxococcales bacterium]|nr:hypothetical protein [Myxococcales bacterium]